MAAVNATPEAGDAPNPCNIHRRDKYLRTARNCRRSSECHHANGDLNDGNPLLSVPNTTSNSNLREALCNDAALIERGDLREADTSAQLRVDSCGFPYYSNRSVSRSQDAVLVKDAAVLCTLLNDRTSAKDDIRTSTDTCEESDINSKSSTMENYLVRQLKFEYNDLSNITRKISAYTKDILSSLLSRDRKKSRTSRKSMHNKQAVASHHVGEMGNPYLGLRPLDDAGTQYSPQRNVSDIGSRPDGMRSQRRNTTDTTGGKEQRAKRSATRTNADGMNLRNEYCLRKLFPVGSAKAKIDSSTCSSSSVYNFLMAGKRQSSKEMSRTTFRKLHSAEQRRRTQKKPCAGQQCKVHSETYETVPVTNWKEITSALMPKSDVLPVDVTSTESTRKVVRDRNRRSSAFKGKHSGRGTMQNTNNFLHDTNFHTINIRIITKDSKH